MTVREAFSPEHDELVAHVMAWLEARRDTEDAAGMAAYMKITERKDKSPPLGVNKKVLKSLYRELKRNGPPDDERALLGMASALWAQPWREPKYVAIELLRIHNRSLLTPRALPTLKRMIREGAWWDLVDGLAVWLVSPLYQRHRAEVRPVLDRWRRSPGRGPTSGGLWLRRSVLLAHLKHREHTDEEALFDDVLALMHEGEFFIRKAIGWALRDYSYTAPDAVKRFLLAHRDELSGLSFREGAKQLVRSGAMSSPVS